MIVVIYLVLMIKYFKTNAFYQLAHEQQQQLHKQFYKFTSVFFMASMTIKNW